MRTHGCGPLNSLIIGKTFLSSGRVKKPLHIVPSVQLIGCHTHSILDFLHGFKEYRAEFASQLISVDPGSLFEYHVHASAFSLVTNNKLSCTS